MPSLSYSLSSAIDVLMECANDTVIDEEFVEDKEVIEKAKKTKVLDKMLEVNVPNEIYERLLELI